MVRICKTCNKEFPKQGKRLYCSKECKRINKNTSRYKKFKLFFCKICNKEFLQKRKDKVACSGSCSEKLWILNNPQKNWERHNGVSAKIRKKIWNKNNKDRLRKIKQKYKSKRRKIDIQFRLNEIIGNAIRMTIKNKNTIHWETLVGYNLSILKEHLEKTLPDNITWNDFLNGGFHIDHIIPIVLYNFTSYVDIDFKKCWNYRNLRIIEAKENLKNLDLLM